MSAGTTKNDAKPALNRLHRAWLIALSQAVGMKPSRMAVNALVSDSTVTRIIYDDNYTGALSAGTVQRLVAKYKVPSPDLWTPGQSILPEHIEGVRVDLDQDPIVAGFMKAISATADAEAWRLQTRSIDAIGYALGDIVIVEPKRDPQPGEVVLAKMTRTDGEPGTIFRVFEPPYLVPASATGEFRRPLLIDNEFIIVRGTVVASARLPLPN